jgi:hypothetical protein
MDSDEIFDDIVLRLEQRGVKAGNTFGKRALKAGSKAFGCLMDGELACRLGAETLEHAEALALDGAQLFDPSARDKPFKDWVQIPVAYGDQWPRFAEAALDHLGQG